MLNRSKTYKKLCKIRKSKIIAVFSAVCILSIITFIPTILTKDSSYNIITIILSVVVVGSIGTFIKILDLKSDILEDWEKMIPLYIHWAFIAGTFIFWGAIIKFYVGTKPNTTRESNAITEKI